MDGFGTSSRYGGGDRRREIVSGKSYGASQVNGTRPQSPDPAPVPPRARRTSHGDSLPWGFSDPEAKRKKRIYKYKAYTVEGKVKASLRKGLRWIKNKCSEIVHGY